MLIFCGYTDQIGLTFHTEMITWFDSRWLGSIQLIWWLTGNVWYIWKVWKFRKYQVSCFFRAFSFAWTRPKDLFTAPLVWSSSLDALFVKWLYLINLLLLNYFSLRFHMNTYEYIWLHTLVHSLKMSIPSVIKESVIIYKV